MLSSSRQHLSYDDCLEDKKRKLSEVFCVVLYRAVIHTDTHTHTREQFLKLTVRLHLLYGLLFMVALCKVK